jgi:hypothetical protein
MLRIFTRCMQAVTVRPLSSVCALVRFAEEPQMFAIEFSDGCPIHVSLFYATLVVHSYGINFLMHMP